MAYIKGVDRNQITMFPESVDDYIREDNPVRVIEAFAASLNIDKLGFKYAQTAPVGRPPYDPRDLLKLYLYGYLNRIRSSRKLESEASRKLVDAKSPCHRKICHIAEKKKRIGFQNVINRIPVYGYGESNDRRLVFCCVSCRTCVRTICRCYSGLVDG